MSIVIKKAGEYSQIVKFDLKGKQKEKTFTNSILVEDEDVSIMSQKEGKVLFKVPSDVVEIED